jgi:hypothetical protein
MAYAIPFCFGFDLGWPRLKWVVTDSKYLSKPPKDWQPHISPAGTEPAYIEVCPETMHLLSGSPLALVATLMIDHSLVLWVFHLLTYKMLCSRPSVLIFFIISTHSKER